MSFTFKLFLVLILVCLFVYNIITSIEVKHG